MAETTNLNIRIDRDLKSEADFILGRMGMNLSTAVNVFVRQVVQERAIPFRIQLADDVYIEDGAREKMKAALKAMQDESVKNGTNQMSMEEIDAEIAAYRREKEVGCPKK
ncbi:MAG: type II toxin-antitoxin system RelB/DinJ family antitoxin [Oscillospiraceae bacterium]|nr:type II toxin-antitoxin system RelB/DinJ family antitoxin [Oscillospiraceae bacterium]